MKEAVTSSPANPDTREPLTSIPLDGQLQTEDGHFVAEWTWIPPWQSQRSATGEIMIIRATGTPETYVGFSPLDSDTIIRLYHWLEENRQFKIVDITARRDLERKKSREALAATSRRP